MDTPDELKRAMSLNKNSLKEMTNDIVSSIAKLDVGIERSYENALLTIETVLKSGEQLEDIALVCDKLDRNKLLEQEEKAVTEKLETLSGENERLRDEIKMAEYIGGAILQYYKNYFSFEFEEKKDVCVIVFKFKENSDRFVEITFDKALDTLVDFSVSPSVPLNQEQLQVLKTHLQESNNFTTVLVFLRKICLDELVL